jgi:hypothetical protein
LRKVAPLRDFHSLRIRRFVTVTILCPGVTFCDMRSVTSAALVLKKNFNREPREIREMKKKGQLPAFVRVFRVVRGYTLFPSTRTGARPSPGRSDVKPTTAFEKAPGGSKL